VVRLVYQTNYRRRHNATAFLRIVTGSSEGLAQADHPLTKTIDPLSDSMLTGT